MIIIEIVVWLLDFVIIAVVIIDSAMLEKGDKLLTNRPNPRELPEIASLIAKLLAPHMLERNACKHLPLNTFLN